MRRRRGLLRQLPFMRRDDFPAGFHAPMHPLPRFGFRLRLESFPLRLELPQGRRVERVMDSMTVPFERCTERIDLAFDTCDPQLFGAYRIALLLDDLVDALVLAAQLFEELLELGRIGDGLRRELAYAAGRTLEDERRDFIGVIDQGERLGQMRG